jgi:hypothetical protein
MPSQAAALKALPLFADLSHKNRELIARRIDGVSFAAGATLTSEGESNHTFYVPADREADVSVGGQARRTLRRGDFFGDISMQHRTVASATILESLDPRCKDYQQIRVVAGCRRERMR